jgi:hypothetical protein
MVETDLPFGARTAERLMAISANRVLSNPAHRPVLPTSWRTLYALSRLPPKILLAKLNDGLITPETERAEVEGWQIIQPADKADTITAKPTRVEQEPAHDLPAPTLA